MKRGSLAAALLLAVAATTVSTRAAAYCRAKACDDKAAYDDVWQEEPDPACVRDSNGCLLEGVPLHWPKTCISFGVQKDGSLSDGIDYQAAHDVVSAAFQAWLDVDCGGSGPSLAIHDSGPIECTAAQYHEDRPNANVFVFRDESWPYRDAWDTLALTTLSYNMENGQIYDADVEINSADAPFVVGDTIGMADADLLGILTHEVGHFLGLSHSDETAATMWATYENGDLRQRTLHNDDAAGACEIYPPDRAVNRNDCEPRHGFASECPPPPEEGCAVAPGRTGAQTPLLLLALALSRVLRRRRRH